jgi:DNA repair protein RadD
VKLTPRPYQAQGINDIRVALRSHRSVLYVAPTGAGKTVLFTCIAEGCTERGRHVWIVVHRSELLDQASASLDKLGIPHGVVAPGFTPNRELVQVCSVNTLVRRLESKLLTSVDLIVLDEGHHASAGMWRKIITLRPDAKILGVTATPERADGQGLGVDAGGVYETMILGPSTAELIRDGWLTPFTIYAPPVRVDMTGVRTLRSGDYDQREIADRTDRPSITGDAVAHYKRIAPGLPGIAFCASVAHAKHVAEQFRAAGFRSESIDGEMSREHRKQLITGLGSGRIHVLTSCDIVSEGTDIPIVTVASLLRPTQSLGLYLQQVGRVLRPAPGKKQAIILDHVGNTRHGWPDDPRDWSLDGRKQRSASNDEEPTVRFERCPKCFICLRPAPVCPGCGYAFAPEVRAPQYVRGELEEVTAQDREKREAAIAKQREVGRAKTREQLEAIAKARGYKPGWVDNILRARGQLFQRRQQHQGA